MMRIIIVFFTFLIPMLIGAQDVEDVQQRDFKKEEWRRATQGIDYSEDVVKPRQQRQRNQGGTERQPPSVSFGGNASPILKVLIIILLVVALFFLIRSLLGLNNPKNKAVKPVLSVEEWTQLEENLHQADLDDFIRRALAQDNFTLAVRLYYLAILKELSIKNFIQWKKNKTNRDYLREMNQTPMAGAFAETTLLFERVWYGNVTLQRQEFEQLEPKFRTFMHQITSTTTPVAS